MNCPTCGGEAFLLGQLGELNYARCRCCGIVFCIDGAELAELVDEEN